MPAAKGNMFPFGPVMKQVKNFRNYRYEKYFKIFDVSIGRTALSFM